MIASATAAIDETPEVIGVKGSADEGEHIKLDELVAIHVELDDRWKGATKDGPLRNLPGPSLRLPQNGRGVEALPKVCRGSASAWVNVCEDRVHMPVNRAVVQAHRLV
jgi:hypothetical protein